MSIAYKHSWRLHMFGSYVIYSNTFILPANSALRAFPFLFLYRMIGRRSAFDAEWLGKVGVREKSRWFNCLCRGLSFWNYRLSKCRSCNTCENQPLSCDSHLSDGLKCLQVIKSNKQFLEKLRSKRAADFSYAQATFLQTTLRNLIIFCLVDFGYLPEDGSKNVSRNLTLFIQQARSYENWSYLCISPQSPLQVGTAVLSPMKRT